MSELPLQSPPEQESSDGQLKDRLKAIEGKTLGHAHRFIVRRLRNLRDVRRHAIIWLGVIIALTVAVWWQTMQVMATYTVSGPSEGGTFTEGVAGTVDNVNPIFASTPAERSVSRLLFANLLTYDSNNRLVGELAESWRAAEDGKEYFVTLRADARWQDGTKITADDVLFTFSTIKSADAKSPLYSSWRNISIEKVDERTVKFTLPTPYAPFPNSLVLGILPKHILGDLRPSEMRNNSYNRNPVVVSGTFTFQDMRALDSDRRHYFIRLDANKDYFGGAPKLARFNIHTYADRELLLNAFRTQEIAAVSDLSTDQLRMLGDTKNAVHHEAPLFNGVYSFFKMDNPILQDAKVRQALVMATDQGKIIRQLDSRVEGLGGPLLPGQLGYSENSRQAGYDLNRAGQLLDEAGWKLGPDGKRAKDGQQLRLRLVALASGDYPQVAEEVIEQWSKLGVLFDSQLVKAEDFQQNVILPRAYDVLIYELAIGKDPDVYAYWHSSQSNERGFNLSGYKSGIVDDALSSARSTLDLELRTAKYRTFVDKWVADAPAVALYRPSLSYVQTPNVTSFPAGPIVQPADRYFSVRYWSSAKEQLYPTR